MGVQDLVRVLSNLKKTQLQEQRFARSVVTESSDTGTVEATALNLEKALQESPDRKPFTKPSSAHKKTHQGALLQAHRRAVAVRSPTFQQ